MTAGTTNGPKQPEPSATGWRNCWPTRSTGTAPQSHPLGHLGGHTLSAQVESRHDGPRILVEVDGTPIRKIEVSAQDVEQAAPGLVVRFENALGTLDRTLAATHEKIDTVTEEINRARAGLGQPFKHQAALDEARTRRSEVAAKMAAKAAAAAARPNGADASTAGEAAEPDQDIAATLEVLADMRVDGHSPASWQTAPPSARPYSPPTVQRDTTPGLD